MSMTKNKEEKVEERKEVEGFVALVGNSPTYRSLCEHDLLCFDYMRERLDDIFIGSDFKANSSKSENLRQRIRACFLPPVFGLAYYLATHSEFFVPAGHVGLLMDNANNYLFAQPGMHNIKGYFTRVIGAPQPLRGVIRHGNRTIAIIDEGFIGHAEDNGKTVLLPPGIHVWTSDSLDFKCAVDLNQDIVRLGPYTIVTVDAGYAAVTMNNGEMVVCDGGATHLLDHAKWSFDSYMSLKVRALCRIRVVGRVLVGALPLSPAC